MEFEIEIGDLVMLPFDKYEDEVYGYVTGYDEEGFLCVEWFDGEKSREFPSHLTNLKKLLNG